jgi:hypothetical protein
VNIVDPFVKVLWLVDGEKLDMEYIYEAMDEAKEKIKGLYKDRVAKYGPIREIIDKKKWYNQLHHPIHPIEYFLNQGIITMLSLEKIKLVKDGLCKFL